MIEFDANMLIGIVFIVTAVILFGISIIFKVVRVNKVTEEIIEEYE